MTELRAGTPQEAGILRPRATSLVTATLSFEKLHRWETVFPWRDWRATHQSGTSELIAEEFRKLANGS